MIPKLNLQGVKEVTSEIKEKVLNNFITNVSIINSSDILLTFSFYNKEKLLVSLNHNSPFVGFVNSSYNSPTTLGNLNENLRKYLKGSYIIEVEQINSDRVMKFTLSKTDDFYQKETYYLILELIPTVNNLIILDKDEKIVFSKHYTDLTAARPILRGMKYLPLEANSNLVIKPFNMDEYKENIVHYLSEIDSKSKKEKALPLFNHLKQKEKSLNKKINVLYKEIEDAKKKLEYKEIGETLLTLMNDKDGLNDYLPFIKESYDSSISVKDNANKYFEKYKKAKRTIENDNREISIAEENIVEIRHIIDIFPYYSDQEIEELYKVYLPKQINSKRKNKEVDARMPYYIVYKGVKIGFGKNKEQNNYLTFKKANRDDIYLHTAFHHGAHVVIFDHDPDKEVIHVASEIALILSNLSSGDIYIADIKDVKKGDSLGQVNLLKHQTITLNNIRDNTKQLLKNQQRFQN